MHTFKIHAPLNSNETTVEMDGKRVEGVTRVEFSIAAKQVVEVKLTVLGYVDITGEFRESELIRVAREGEHPGMLRARVRRAFNQQFPQADDIAIKSFTDLVMAGLESEPS
jgi:hypothetical protein